VSFEEDEESQSSTKGLDRREAQITQNTPVPVRIDINANTNAAQEAQRIFGFAAIAEEGKVHPDKKLDIGS